jgi:hypothetical protein
MSIKATIVGAVVTLECIDVLSVEDLDALFKAFDNARRAGPFVVITDTTHMKSAPREVLGAFASRLKQLPPLTNVWLGDAVVISSTAVRFVVSTLLVIPGISSWQLSPLSSACPPRPCSARPCLRLPMRAEAWRPAARVAAPSCCA